MYDPELKTWQEGLPVDISKTLKRRYFLVEKAKNANVIGTLLPSIQALVTLNLLVQGFHGVCIPSVLPADHPSKQANSFIPVILIQQPPAACRSKIFIVMPNGVNYLFFFLLVTNSCVPCGGDCVQVFWLAHLGWQAIEMQ